MKETAKDGKDRDARKSKIRMAVGMSPRALVVVIVVVVVEVVFTGWCSVSIEREASALALDGARERKGSETEIDRKAE